MLVFSNLKISTKILGLVCVMLALLVSVSAFALIKIGHVGEEVENIAENQLPMLHMISDLTATQLEMAVWFERALRHGGVKAEEKELFELARENIQKMYEKGESVVKEGEGIVQGLVHAAVTEKDKAEVQALLARLTAVQEIHDAYEKHVFGAVEAIESGDMALAGELAVMAEEEEEKVDKELEAILETMSNFAQQAANKAEQDEKATYSGVMGLAGLAAVLGLAIGLFLSIKISGPLKKGAAFARRLAGGDLSGKLDVQGKDEVGQICAAMNEISAALDKVRREFGSASEAIDRGRLRGRADESGFSGAFQDMIKETNAMLDTLVNFIDQMPTPLLTMDKDLRVLFFNVTGSEIIGRDPRGLEGSEALELIKAVGQRSEKSKFGFVKTLEEDSLQEGEGRVVMGDKEMEVKYICVPNHAMNGELVGVMEIIIDQTEIKTAQLKMVDLANESERISMALSSAAEELSAQVEEASRGAEVQKERAVETATAMEEMNASVGEVAQNASQAAEFSDQTRSSAQSGADIVGKVVTAIADINRNAMAMKDNLDRLGVQTEGIGRIMNVINDIADQTNLLALNAAIEAARAGEAGRGFAVVADEVRKLAEKTMEATREVGDAITSIQDGAKSNIEAMSEAARIVGRSTEFAEASRESLNEIVSLSDKASEQVQAIAAASEEQSAASEEIVRGTDEISRISAETSDSMRQAAEAITGLASLAVDLQSVISRMQSREE